MQRCLGEALRAFELSRRGLRTEHRNPSVAEYVGQSGRPVAAPARSPPGRYVCRARMPAPLIDRPDRAGQERHVRRCRDFQAPRKAGSRRGDCASFQASAFSRPPDPMRSILIDARNWIAEEVASSTATGHFSAPTAMLQRQSTTAVRERWSTENNYLIGPNFRSAKWLQGDRAWLLTATTCPTHHRAIGLIALLQWQSDLSLV